MAVAGWIVDKSVAARVSEPTIRSQVAELAGRLHVCPVGQLEQLYSARSAREYDELKVSLSESFGVVPAPQDVLEQALALQRDLAHHHGMWHRVPIPDLLLAVVALSHDMGIVHVDGDFEKIAEVRPLTARRLRLNPHPD